jgi:hypothetical protein
MDGRERVDIFTGGVPIAGSLVLYRPADRLRKPANLAGTGAGQNAYT